MNSIQKTKSTVLVTHSSFKKMIILKLKPYHINKLTCYKSLCNYHACANIIPEVRSINEYTGWSS